VRRCQPAQWLASPGDVADADVCVDRLIRRVQPPVVNDDNTSPSHLSGERHLSRCHRDNGLTGCPRQVDASMTGTVDMVRRGERSYDRRRRVERPDPARTGASLILGVRRSRRQQQAEAGDE